VEERGLDNAQTLRERENRKTGRPRVRLEDLVRERRFNAKSPRHRRALADGDLDALSDEHLVVLAIAYRHALGRAERASLARSFQARANS
jgi:hypothetical protein